MIRTSPVAKAPEASLWATGLGPRKRLDGGYSVAHGSLTDVDVGPDNIRLPTVDPASYRFDRFIDSSNIEVIAGF